MPSRGSFCQGSPSGQPAHNAYAASSASPHDMAARSARVYPS